MEVNTTAAQEHVGEIEHAIKFVKEQLQCIISTLSDSRFKYYHDVIIVNGVYFVIMMINALTAPNGIFGLILPQ